MVQVFIPEPFAVHCLFQDLFSIPCPTCGMTRAIQRMLALDFQGAFLTQPLVLLAPLFILCAILLLKQGGSAAKGRVLVSSAVVILAVNWIYLIVVN